MTTFERIVIVAPTIYTIRLDGYGGIERLVYLFAKGLLHHGVKPVIVASNGSRLPDGAVLFPTGEPIYDFQEPLLLPTLRECLRVVPGVGVVFDFSHSKPTHGYEFQTIISPIWHDPYIMKPSVPRHNIACLSQWQADRFEAVYYQDCRVLDPICADPEYFTPGDNKGDYCLFIGKLHPTKGCVQAIEACKSLKERLHIIGPVTPGDPEDYVKLVMGACDGEDIVYHGEVTEEGKRALIQGAKCLLYPVSYPPGTGESHSHKMVEAMMAGVPCIAYDQGAMSEVIEESVTGYVIRGRDQLKESINACEELDRLKCRERAVEHWDYRRVVERWLEAAESVVKGQAW